MNRVRALAHLLWPAAGVLGLLLLWQAVVWLGDIPSYTLPGPWEVLQVLWQQRLSLAPSWWFTLRITGASLGLAALGGVVLAAVLAMSPRLERAVWPVAVVLQVTPMVAIAPLLLIYIDSTTVALLCCTVIVAFFPILSNTVQGLRSTDPLLRDWFALAGATPWQTVWRLYLPSALPDFLAGLRVSGGLSLIGAVTAEMVAGTAGRDTGLASRILEASFRTETPKMFAALLLLVLTGVALHLVLQALSRWALRPWHPSTR